MHRNHFSHWKLCPNFLKSIVTGDKTWCFQQILKQTDKLQIENQKTHHKAKGQEKLHPKSKPCSLHSLIVSVSTKNVFQLHKHLLLSYFLNVLKCLIARICFICREYRSENSWCSLHYNACSHSSFIVHRFLAKNNICVLYHPPYLSDLAPCYLSLSQNLKLKRCYFDHINCFDMCFGDNSAKWTGTDIQIIIKSL